jgi:hypothetical protein
MANISRSAIVQNLMKRLGVATPTLEETQIDRDTNGSSQGNTPDTSSNRSMAREPSLQSLDIDGIIQSFVREREQENYLVQGGPSGRANPSDSTANHVQPMWPYPTTTDMPGIAPLAEQDAGGAVSYDNQGNWIYQGQQQQIFGEDTVTVDDLLYGFNGSALDRYPIMDWDTM